MTDPTPATGHEVAPPLTVITAPTGVTAAQVRVLLRTLAEVRDALRASAESCLLYTSPSPRDRG